MPQKTAIRLFESQKVRSIWDAEKQRWFFAIVDVVLFPGEQSSFGFSQYSNVFYRFKVIQIIYIRNNNIQKA